MLTFPWNLCKIILLGEEINKKSKFVHSDAEARWFWKEILWLFHDFLTFDMRASQRNQAYQIKPLKKFLSWICHRFSNPNAGFDATNVLISHMLALWQVFFSHKFDLPLKRTLLFSKSLLGLLDKVCYDFCRVDAELQTLATI